VVTDSRRPSAQTTRGPCATAPVPGQRIGRLGGLVAAAVALTPFAFLWIAMMHAADDPLTARVRLDMAIGLTVFGTPWMLAAWLLWRAWWRQAGATLSTLDGPGWLLAATAATLPAERRAWGAAMAAELAQVQGRLARWRFAAGCARAAVFLPVGGRAAVAVAAALAGAALAVAWLGTGAALPAGQVFALSLVGLLGGLVTLRVARRGRVGWAGPGLGVAGLAWAGLAGCVAATGWYLAEYPLTRSGHPSTISATLPPVTAVVFAVVLAGCVWLTLAPPRWLVGDRPARLLGIAMALALVAGFLLGSRLSLRGVQPAGMMSYLFAVPPLVLLTGSAAAAAVGRSFRAGLWACAWATVLAAPLLIAAWLAEAPRWYRQVGGLLLDADGGGMGANLGDAIWWTLIMLVLWALPIGVLGAAAGSAPARRRRARAHAEPAPTA
jgi:hypothetical protein